MTGPRRLSQAISEGDGISLIVAVAGPEEARQAEAGGAEALLADDVHVDAIREVSALPIIGFGGQAGDACIISAGGEDVELHDGIELVVRVEREEELEEALEHFDPELVVLGAGDEENAFERVLDLLSDLPAGKLAIADLRNTTRPEIDELERAGVDAVLLRELP